MCRLSRYIDCMNAKFLTTRERLPYLEDIVGCRSLSLLCTALSSTSLCTTTSVGTRIVGSPRERTGIHSTPLCAQSRARPPVADLPAIHIYSSLYRPSLIPLPLTSSRAQNHNGRPRRLYAGSYATSPAHSCGGECRLARGNVPGLRGRPLGQRRPAVEGHDGSRDWKGVSRMRLQ